MQEVADVLRQERQALERLLYRLSVSRPAGLPGGPVPGMVGPGGRASAPERA